MYAMVLWVHASLVHYVGSGPFWDYGDQAYSQHTICAKNWWFNLMYINNFQPTSDLCMDWAWYLANDMQYHFVSPIFLIALQ